jgi:COP9 signalosome complex subunit 5
MEGEPIEVMGLLVGGVEDGEGGGVFRVDVALPLPVEGTETRVNAGAAALEAAVQLCGAREATGLSHRVIGWYHSHPGYGPWLSGIDVATQDLQQRHQDPYVALVIDPTASAATGSPVIGAFRTVPEGTPPRDGGQVSGGGVGVPLRKAEDYGAHASRYYELAIDHVGVGSQLEPAWAAITDSLWASGVVGPSPTSTLRYRGDRVADVAEKLAAAAKDSGAASGGMSRMGGAGAGTLAVHGSAIAMAEATLAGHAAAASGAALASLPPPPRSQLDRVADDAALVSCDTTHAAIAQVLRGLALSSTHNV